MSDSDDEDIFDMKTMVGGQRFESGTSKRETRDRSAAAARAPAVLCPRSPNKGRDSSGGGRGRSSAASSASSRSNNKRRAARPPVAPPVTAKFASAEGERRIRGKARNVDAVGPARRASAAVAARQRATATGTGKKTARAAAVVAAARLSSTLAGEEDDEPCTSAAESGDEYLYEDDDDDDDDDQDLAQAAQPTPGYNEDEATAKAIQESSLEDALRKAQEACRRGDDPSPRGAGPILAPGACGGIARGKQKRGIQNGGNTCYLGSLLQLVSIPSTSMGAAFVQLAKSTDNDKRTKLPVTFGVGDIADQVNSPPAATEGPLLGVHHPFIGADGYLGGGFATVRQQHCVDEAHCRLFDRVREEATKAEFPVPPPLALSAVKSTTTIHCPGCQTSHDNLDEAPSIRVSFADGAQKPATLQQLLEDTTQKETRDLAGCQCGAQITHASLKYHELPETLVVFVRRAAADGTKLDTPLKFGLTGTPLQDEVYDVKGIIVHDGERSDSGHYSAYVPAEGDGTGWLHVNDSRVTEVGAGVVTDQNPAMFVMERQGRETAPKVDAAAAVAAFLEEKSSGGAAGGGGAQAVSCPGENGTNSECSDSSNVFELAGRDSDEEWVPSSKDPARRVEHSHKKRDRAKTAAAPSKRQRVRGGNSGGGTGRTSNSSSNNSGNSSSGGGSGSGSKSRSMSRSRGRSRSSSSGGSGSGSDEADDLRRRKGKIPDNVGGGLGHSGQSAESAQPRKKQRRADKPIDGALQKLAGTPEEVQKFLRLSTEASPQQLALCRALLKDGGAGLLSAKHASNDRRIYRGGATSGSDLGPAPIRNILAAASQTRGPVGDMAAVLDGPESTERRRAEEGLRRLRVAAEAGDVDAFLGVCGEIDVSIHIDTTHPAFANNAGRTEPLLVGWGACPKYAESPFYDPDCPLLTGKLWRAAVKASPFGGDAGGAIAALNKNNSCSRSVHDRGGNCFDSTTMPARVRELSRTFRDLTCMLLLNRFPNVHALMVLSFGEVCDQGAARHGVEWSGRDGKVGTFASHHICTIPGGLPAATSNFAGLCLLHRAARDRKGCRTLEDLGGERRRSAVADAVDALVGAADFVQPKKSAAAFHGEKKALRAGVEENDEVFEEAFNAIRTRLGPALFTKQQCSDGGEASIAKRKEDPEKYRQECADGGEASIAKRKEDPEKYRQECADGGKKGGNASWTGSSKGLSEKETRAAVVRAEKARAAAPKEDIDKADQVVAAATKRAQLAKTAKKRRSNGGKKGGRKGGEDGCNMGTKGGTGSGSSGAGKKNATFTLKHAMRECKGLNPGFTHARCSQGAGEKCGRCTHIEEWDGLAIPDLRPGAAQGAWVAVLRSHAIRRKVPGGGNRVTTTHKGALVPWKGGAAKGKSLKGADGVQYLSEYQAGETVKAHNELYIEWSNNNPDNK